MITALSWIPKGASRAHPVRFELSKEELERVQRLAKEEQELEGANEDESGEGDEGEGEQMDAAARAENDEDNFGLPAELRMDEYDNEEDDEELHGVIDNDDDNADDADEMLLEGDNQLLDEPEDEEDEEDNEIKPTDMVLALAMTEDEYSRLEIQVLSAEGSLYTHHDILLPDFPLCLAWMDCPPYLSADGNQNTTGNYMAVGTFSPSIEIWNLDVLDVIEPSAVLGGTQEPSKKSKKSKLVPGSHSDAVLSLAWNSVYRQALASGSGDSTVKVWDITTQTCSHTFSHHLDKVQSVKWHSKEAWLLASGSFDKSVCLIDCRSGGTAKLSDVGAEIESLAWNPFNAYQLFASLENGHVVCMDVRNCTSMRAMSDPRQSTVFSFRAHSKPASSIQFCDTVEGLFATASVDKTVKVWDTQSLTQIDGEEAPCVAYKTMNAGKLLAMQFNTDTPFLLATAGDKGIVAVWESDENDTIRNHFEGRIGAAPSVSSEEIVGIAADTKIVEELYSNEGIAGSTAKSKPKSKGKNKSKA